MTFELVSSFEQTLRSIVDVNLRPFYNDVGKILLNATADNFETEGMYFDRGIPWQPLAQSTIEQRKNLGFFPIRILRRQAGNAGLLGSINYTATDEGVTIGTNLYYAEYLHTGTWKMPARPIFPNDELPPDMLEDIEDAYYEFMRKFIANTFF